MKSMEDFSEWYLWVVREGEFVDQRSPIKGFDVLLPWAYSIWEKIQNLFDSMLKEHGVSNFYFPLVIPRSLLEKEAEHFQGFVPEVAWVTHEGDKPLNEWLALRPTSETIMYYMFRLWIHSYRDLPFRVNQWCNIVRWETKATKPLIRTREVLWHECHTAHATRECAMREVKRSMDLYTKLFRQYLCLPFIILRRTELDKFPGADITYAFESVTKEGKILQIATTHLLGQNFSKVFGIKYKDAQGKDRLVWQTSWGFTTRLIGAMIMVHGDEYGAVLPPKVAPLQVVIVPIPMKGGPDVLEKAREVEKRLKELGLRVKVDDGPETPGFKFNKWELKGVPLRLEIGPRDLEKGCVTAARRDTHERIEIKENELHRVKEILEQIQKDLLRRAEEFFKDHITYATSLSEAKRILEEKGGFVKIDWCGSERCELKVKEEGVGEIRGYVEDEKPKGNCAVCGAKAKHVAYVGRAY